MSLFRKFKIYYFVIYFYGFIDFWFVPNSAVLSLIKAFLEFLICYEFLINVGRKNWEFHSYERYSLLFIVLLIIFNLIRLNSSIIDELNGMREFIVFIFSQGVLRNIIRINYVGIKEFLVKYLPVLFIFQLITSIFQFSIYGAGDFVSGTFGRNNSGNLTVSLYLLVIVYFVNLKLKFNIFRKILGVFIVLIPTFINETKIGLFVLPILLFVLFFDGLKLKNILTLSLMLTLFFALIGNYFIDQQGVNTNFTDEIYSVDYLEKYLLGEDTEEHIGATDYAFDAPRFYRINYTINNIFNEHDKILFGNGFGYFKGGGIFNKIGNNTNHDWLFTGTIPYLSLLLYQGGVVFLFFYLYLLYKSFYHFKYYDISLKKYVNFGFFILIVILFYSEGLRSPSIILTASLYFSFFKYDKFAKT